MFKKIISDQSSEMWFTLIHYYIDSILENHDQKCLRNQWTNSYEPYN